MADSKAGDGVIPRKVVHIIASVVYVGFALMCVAILFAWMYIIGVMIGIWGGTAVDLSRMFTAFAMTVAIGCIALWAAGQVEIIDIGEDVEKRIWNTVIAATITALLSSLGVSIPRAFTGKGGAHTSSAKAGVPGRQSGEHAPQDAAP